MEFDSIKQFVDLGFTGLAALFLGKVVFNDLAHLNVDMRDVKTKLDKIVELLERHLTK